jgi:hypothetical protein
MKKLNNVYEAPKTEMVELFAEGGIMSFINSTNNESVSWDS